MKSMKCGPQKSFQKNGDGLWLPAQQELSEPSNWKVMFALGEALIRQRWVEPVKFAAFEGPTRDFRRRHALTLQWLEDEIEIQRVMNVESQACH